ncbi:ImmA/IrrE family metallo-endopeptidase [Dyella sedimenti]|uniref:ImmA/IrrE family metallo-endopeptidase n=1 Tax=Dyella sedimenti TaxID=2919947 RepID=UPI001FA95E8D|nr:ImmA/IrrE family metallo-endopeptidase [Dyella sedimenti]
MRKRGYEVPPLRKLQVWRAARELREASRIDAKGHVAHFPLHRFLEMWLPKVWENFYLGTKEKAEMGDDHGWTYPDRGVIFLREDVYEGLRLNRGRDRFTAAHELGHFVLHDNPLARSFRSSENLEVFRDSEWQADNFAGEFLMPVEVVRKYPDAYILAAECGVSEIAASVRISELRKERML